MNINLENIKIGIIGLGYVGLPLAVEFGKQIKVVGFDLNQERISQLNNYIDKTLETSEDELRSAKKLSFTSDKDDLNSANFYIVTVPTPVDDKNVPDTSALEAASNTIGQYLKNGDVVVYESTVYPGCTEELCVPILEETSGLKLNIDFFCGYSPERINPGDKDHRLVDIVKVTSGSNEIAADLIDSVYKKIIKAGTYKASSIKVAEASKVIENTQRDLNIALMNELSKIFNILDIDTLEVLEAAGTKWNFLPFRPGLVGGHCIGVDPYYLTFKAEKVGYKPEVIISGRTINDSIGEYVSNKTMELIKRKSQKEKNYKILIMGLTFKENCPDIRNTKVVDIIEVFEENEHLVHVYDPLVDKKEAMKEYGIDCINMIPKDIKYDAVVVTVAHDDFKKIKHDDIKALCEKNGVIVDCKSIFPKNIVDMRL